MDNSVWNRLYWDVLHNGRDVAPRGRRTRELLYQTYTTTETQHIDTRRGRSMSLDYLKREFLWYCKGDRFDVRIAEYAPLWRSCIDAEGGINSNYGQYLFVGEGFDCPFFNQLDQIVADPHSRRCWIPIWSQWHTFPDAGHVEVPCTTGFGFVLRDEQLHMSVHMRSQDLWHGTPYDEGTAYLFQLMAVAYLVWRRMPCRPGYIRHTVDSLHLYERHWLKASDALNDPAAVLELESFQLNCYNYGLTFNDLLILRGVADPGIKPSGLLWDIMDIDGAYGRDEWGTK